MITNEKGLRSVLTERGINCTTLKKDDMIKILSQHDDFRDEKTIVESFLLAKGHYVMFFPKFHCEIERVWAQVKCYTRAHCNYSYVGLQRTVSPGLDSVDTHLIRKARDYICAYREDHAWKRARRCCKEVQISPESTKRQIISLYE